MLIGENRLFAGSPFIGRNNNNLYGVFGHGSDKIIVVCASQSILKRRYSSDFNLTWRNRVDPIFSSTSFYYDKVQFTNSNFAFAVGGCALVIGSLDKGENWFSYRNINSYTQDDIRYYGIHFLPTSEVPTRGFIVGSQFFGSDMYEMEAKLCFKVR